MLTVSEYGRIFLADSDSAMADGNLQLNAVHFASLVSLLDAADDDSRDYSPIFAYLRPRGREQLRVQNYVGVIRLADGVQIEVLPKISKRMDAESARKLLVKMLVELADSPFLEGTVADLEAHRMPIFELLMRVFLEHVTSIVRKGVARSYVSREDNLVHLRGKLRMAEHLRRNSFIAGRVFCEFDEYDTDRPINRLIKGALEIVLRLASHPDNQQRCRELLFWFESVPATVTPRLDFQRMQRDRLVQHYAPAMPLCRLILDSLNPLTEQGQNGVVSMLFPMEKVFEAFVAAKLSIQLATWRVSSQAPGQALIEQHLERKMFNLRPDLVMSRRQDRVVADTKWKLIDQSDRANGYGISQADVYQMFGYAKKYLGHCSYREVLLIYPASDTFQAPLEPFWYQPHSEVLLVVPYDLQSETLILPANCLLNQQSQSFSVAQ